MSARLVLEVNNPIGELTRVRAAAEEMGEQESWSPGLAFKVNLALEEVILNVITHGCHEGLKEITITLSSDDEAVMVEIRDDGLPFNPLEDAPAPDLGAAIEERETGGLGVHLVLEMMTHVGYVRENNKNCLTLKMLRDE